MSGDLAYVVAIEHTTASIGGGPTQSYSLRATTILRREDGEWRAIHRHADARGSFAPPPGKAPADTSPQMRLLHLSGRSPSAVRLA